MQKKKKAKADGKNSMALKAFRAREEARPKPKKAVKKAAPAKTSAKHEEPKQGIVLRGKDAPLPAMTAELSKRAHELDRGIRFDFRSIDMTLSQIGRRTNEFFSIGGHRALGFKNFNLWADDVAEGRGYRHSELNRVKGIAERLMGEGPGKVDDADIDAMTKDNAEVLSRVAPEKRSPKLIEAAKELTKKEFEQKAAPFLVKRKAKSGASTVKSTPAGVVIEDEPERNEVMRTIPAMEVSQPVYEHYMKALKVAIFACRDDNRSMPLREKALDAMAAEMIATHGGPEFEAWLETQDTALGG